MGSRHENPEGIMPLVEHLRELRSRVVYSLIAVFFTTVFGYFWYSHSVSLGFLRMLHLKDMPQRIPSLGKILTEPYCELPSPPRAELTGDHSCKLLSTGPFDQFLLRFKIAMTAGIIVACPVWLYHVWSFVAPGLKKNERKYTVFFLSAFVVLFIGGAVLAQLILPEALKFLFFVGDQVQVTALEGEKYFNFLIHLIIIFGISFELPLFMIALNFVRIVSSKRIIAWQRGIIFGLFVFAAIVTPGQDPFSMLALALALTILFEISLVICIVHDRIFARRQKELDKELYVDLSDDIASPLEDQKLAQSSDTLQQEDILYQNIALQQEISSHKDIQSSYDDIL